MIKKILLIATGVAVLAVVYVTWVWGTDPTASMDQKRLYFDAYTAIGIGFLAALLGTIIPNLILESRDNLERAKQSRIAYSQAKTSLIYLPGTLAVLQYGIAMAALQESHLKLHIAETYRKELKEYLTWYGDDKIWSAQIYWELTAVRSLLQSHADEWKNLRIGERTIMVERALEAIKDLVGTRGEKWKRMSDEERNTQADEVVKRVSTSAIPSRSRSRERV